MRLPMHGPFLFGLSHREKDQDYCQTLFYINDGHRLIVCKDNIQWIGQLREGNQWKGRHFLTDDVGLSRVYKGQAEHILSSLTHEVAVGSLEGPPDGHNLGFGTTRNEIHMRPGGGS